MSVSPATADWQRVATLLAHRLISGAQMEAACAALEELADWERQEGAKWIPGTGGEDAADSAALVQAYADAVSLLRHEDTANPFMRPRTSSLAPSELPVTAR